jgi:hypothetical protein
MDAHDRDGSPEGGDFKTHLKTAGIVLTSVGGLLTFGCRWETLMIGTGAPKGKSRPPWDRDGGPEGAFGP